MKGGGEKNEDMVDVMQGGGKKILVKWEKEER
jgi:hypothetical protein